MSTTPTESPTTALLILTPVLCLGETLAERDGEQTEAVLRRQLAAVLDLSDARVCQLNKSALAKMKAALADAGAKGNAAANASQFVVYPDAPHAFHADYRASFRKEAAEDGWKRALAWFKANGVA